MDENTIETALSGFSSILQVIQEFSDEILKIWNGFLERIAGETQEQPKWRRFNAPKIHPLLLDKRSKVHRCRNAC